MADRPIDRAAWGELVAQLVQSETRGKKATFARLVGVDPSTIRNWLAGTVDVSEASVRRVAAALHRDPMELLVAVGYYSADEVRVAGHETPVDYDAAVERVRQSDLPPRMQLAIISRILELRRADEERLNQIVDLLIDQAKGA